MKEQQMRQKQARLDVLLDISRKKLQEMVRLLSETFS